MLWCTQRPKFTFKPGGRYWCGGPDRDVDAKVVGGAIRLSSQNQTVSGAGGLAVSIAGDNNRLFIGAQELTLERKHLRRGKPANLTELLLTDVRATTLVGRDRDIEGLAAWRSGPARVAVRCITGVAGSGKTRLAIEACERAEAEGWLAGFVASGELERFHAQQNLANWHLPKDVLLVVDEAATSAAILEQWFAHLAPRRQSAGGGKLRILLLERHATIEDGWWAVLCRRRSLTSVGAADLVSEERPIELPPIRDLEDRRALFAQVMGLAAPFLDPPAALCAPPPIGVDAAFDARLGAMEIENEPLFLMMAGVHAVREGAPTALALGRVGLAEQIADIEIARAEKFAIAMGAPDKGRLFKHLLACVTLQNGCEVSRLVALAREEFGEIGGRTSYEPEVAAGHLLRLSAEYRRKTR